MSRLSVKIPLNFRILLGIVIMTSWITGITFFILNGWVEIEGEFGPEKHWIQFPMIKIHGASAFLMMIGYGYLLASHVPPAWKTKLRRVSGIAITSAIGFSICTGYMLYYMSNEELREIVKYAHLGTGFILPMLIFYHVVVSKSLRRK